MNIQIVDVVFEGAGYMLDAVSKDGGTTVHRSKRVACSPRACGQPIPRGEYYLFMPGEGRLCCSCAIGLGALTKAEDDRSWELTQDLTKLPF